MGRHTDPATRGSRRAAVLTLTASALLVAGGVTILVEDDGVHHHAAPAATTPGQRVDDATDIGTAPPSSPAPTATSTPSAPASGSPPPSTPLADGDAARQVMALVDAERAKVGCRPLSTDAALVRAAQGHSDDMATRGFFSHTNPDEVAFAERIRAAGYTGRALAENIAAGQTSPAAVVSSWMASPGHRSTILDCSYTATGVGHATGGPYGSYWTQTFGG